MRRFFAPVVALFVGSLLLAGCGSLSDSSKSSSKIVSSPFTSSSGSSSPGDSYEADVRDYVASYVKANGAPEDLGRKIAELAGKHGISDWERNEKTYVAIGKGLAHGGARQVEVDAFKSGLKTSAEQAEWIQDGFDDEK